MASVSANCDSPPVSSCHLLAIVEQKIVVIDYLTYFCSGAASTPEHLCTFKPQPSSIILILAIGQAEQVVRSVIPVVLLDLFDQTF